MQKRQLLKKITPTLVKKAYAGGRQGMVRGLQYLQSKDSPDNNKLAVDFEETGIIEARLLIGAARGLLLYDSGRLYRLLSGRYYGITFWRGRWYAFHRKEGKLGPAGLRKPFGQLLSFTLTDEGATDLRIEVTMLDSQIHQIDAFEDRLFITDTTRNCIVQYTLDHDKLVVQHELYPAGTLHNGQQSDNYAHINSVYFTPQRTYLLYHNLTNTTGRYSEVAELSHGLELVKIHPTKSRSAHNVLPTDAGFLICNSSDGCLHLAGQAVFKADCYTRGLAVTDDLLVVGGSEFAKRRNRTRTIGRIFALQRRNFELLGELAIPSAGSIYEVRCVDPTDYAMSVNAKESKPLEFNVVARGTPNVF